MNLTVIGTGFVGVVTAGVFAKLGNQVWGLDVDKAKIESLKAGKTPFFEPDLDKLLKQGIDSGKLAFTTDYGKVIPQSDIVVIAVGTPSKSDGTADLKFVLNASKAAAKYLKADTIIAIKSTVPPGTNNLVESAVRTLTKVKFNVVSLPEFLREGSAVNDTLNPDRILIGSTDKKATQMLIRLHKPLSKNILVMSPESAQMSKYASNAYLALRITFVNQIADLCEANGANIDEVVKAMGQDKRIGDHYWYPGLGYGGSCFPKDVKELAAYSKSIGQSGGLLVKVDQINERRIPKIMTGFSKQIGGFKDKKIALLGLSFKKNTNDTREAPSIKVINYLLDRKAKVVGCDPQATVSIKNHFPNLEVTSDPYQALNNADVLMLLVEWPEFLKLDLEKVSKLMRQPIFIDTRNQYDPKTVKKYGFKYLCIGKKPESLVKA